MESRKVPRLWWREDEAGAEAEKVSVGAGGPRGRRARRPAISARRRRIGPARLHMVPQDGSGNRYGHERLGSSILGSRCRPTVGGGAGTRASLRGRRRRRRRRRRGWNGGRRRGYRSPAVSQAKFVCGMCVADMWIPDYWNPSTRTCLHHKIFSFEVPHHY
jgi:hypothetical protein